MIFAVAPKPQSLVAIGVCFFPFMALIQVIYYEFFNFWVLLCLMWHILKQCFDHKKLCGINVALRNLFIAKNCVFVFLNISY
jgi:hypothetical protein